MPPQTGKSDLLAKYGARFEQAFEAHKHDETELGNMELPPGIENGVAQLVSARIGTFKKGDGLVGHLFFMASGVVLSPAEHTWTDDGGQIHTMRVEGQRTQIGPEPLCDTPQRKSRKTQVEHVAWVLNELRKLGVDTSQMTARNLPATLAALEAAQPTFNFRTWRGKPTKEYPNPRTNHQWGGTCEWNGETDPGAGVEDHSADEPPEEQEEAPAVAIARPSPRGANGAAKPNTAGAPTQAARKAPVTQAARKAPAPPPEVPEFDDGAASDTSTGALADAAAGGDEQAQAELRRRATEAGMSDEDFDAATWDEIKVFLDTAEEAETDGGPETEAPWEPAPEEVYRHAAVDPKTRKKGKAIEYEVTAVDKKARTVSIKSLDDPKKVLKGVPWDALESAV